jgi:hypothetical protein
MIYLRVFGENTHITETSLLHSNPVSQQYSINFSIWKGGNILPGTSPKREEIGHQC